MSVQSSFGYRFLLFMLIAFFYFLSSFFFDFENSLSCTQVLSFTSKHFFFVFFIKKITNHLQAYAIHTCFSLDNAVVINLIIICVF